MYGNKFNLAHIEYSCSIYGPGLRTVVWFQGCSIHCKGCWNTEMWANEPNELIERDELLLKIVTSGSDKVTFLGGEPLDQSENLLWLMTELKKINYDVMLYSGYEQEEIDKDQIKKDICLMADILIIGRYKENERNTNLLWRGSSNQSIKTKVPISIEDMNEVEIHIDEDGRVVCMGYPTDELLNDLMNL